jgi:hypothetical protein
MKDQIYNAFVVALSLSITAPNEELGREMLSAAEDIGASLTEAKVNKAKKIITKAIESGKLHDLIAEKGLLLN